jgi:hypothetical protein
MMRKMAPGVASAACACAAVLALSACGGSGNGSAMQQVRGHVLGGTQAAATVGSALGGAGGICGGAVNGTQVIIKGPAGKLLASTTLHRNTATTAKLNLPSALTGTGQVGIYDFATQIPAGRGPYTVDLVGVNSTVVNGSQLKHLQFSCSGQ